ncbi:uncharacterized protein SPPG_08003 [Spizellomyces punctatus DAOM BR117]|uniref:Cilia- and flagella-associated protein 58 central coiled coil domain-containing protein n=1 Tax=Spizellomyces punctatus (strain DAOM BR117) TaxID=645134 RepID=A0A0L0H5L5_SPIPD|nr:uncharacterized protein SPPG_08003 [Spizellomyces punctatus DAOM BR117]KNC96800.1 hypothetical protein SPPG_08003 [Spizellomyces punctatus DAOM BR117]|eukprot:XP_016604840.1 hypothetical protein SPPG_08003 [Spizellomyces punctatus DAOM BR117]
MSGRRETSSGIKKSRRASVAANAGSMRRDASSASDTATQQAEETEREQVLAPVETSTEKIVPAENKEFTENVEETPLASSSETPVADPLELGTPPPSGETLRPEDASGSHLESDASIPAPPIANVSDPVSNVRERLPAVKDLPGADDKAQHDTMYTTMEIEYDNAWKEVAENDELNPFRIEYEKMHRAVIRSREHIEKLFAQYETSYDEYRVNLAQAQEAKEASVQDQQTIKVLRAQIKRAEEIVESSNKREEAAKEELRQLKMDISNLNATLKQGVGLSTSQEKALQELLQTKEQSTKELDEELEKIVHLRNIIADVSEKIKTADQQKRDLEREIYELRDKSATKKADIDAELRNKERLERDLRELRVVVAVKSQEVRGKQDSVNRATDDISILESQIKSQKNLMEKLLKDQESLTIRTIKLQQDADSQMTTTSHLIEENEALANELKTREAELQKNTFEVKKVARIKDALNKKIQEVEEQKLEAELERKDIRGECEDALAQIERAKKNIDQHKKAIDDLTRERDILQANFHKTQTELHKHGQMLVLCKQARHNIELELARYEREIIDLQKSVQRLEAERDAYITESVALQGSCVAGIQQIKAKEIELFDYKKRTVQADTKLKHQQNLYEAVQSDRNLHSKHLIEAQSEITEMKRKLKIMNFQINGFKEDINAKNQALAAEAAEHAKLEKDIEIITEEINTLQHQNELGQAYIRIQQAESSRLNQFVKDAEMERSRQENALKILITERDNLSNQLIRQNEELAKVYDSIKLQQSSLLRSELHYRDRLKSLNHLRKEILELRRQNATLKSESASFNDMKDTIHRLDNDLLHEQTKIKALEEQLKHPINVHRWRKLEGRNPKAFDMIQLLHTLQRKLIAKSKEEAEKEQLIHSKETLYLHLKSLFAKQVGPEALEQIAEYRHILKDKTMQYKHMGTELNMYQAQLREYKYSIAQLNNGVKAIRDQFMHTNRGALSSPAVRLRSKARSKQPTPPIPHEQAPIASEQEEMQPT